MQFLKYLALSVVGSVLCPGSSVSDARDFAYVSLDGENRIAVYSVNQTTGELIPRPDVETPGAPGGLISDPTSQFLYASLRRDGRLAAFRINHDGGLTLINVVDAGADPAYVATDRSGRFLLTAYYVASKVTVHRIGDDGALSEAPIQEIATDAKAHAIMTDYSNQFAYVPHTGPNAIYQFRFDGKTGHLSPNTPLIINTGTGTGPRQLAFHPKQDLVFFDYEQGSAIASFFLDRNAGQLTFRERRSSIPSTFTGTNSNARIEIHPSGKFIYVANRGHDSIAGFRIDTETGRLADLSPTPTEATPRGFTIEPGGRFLYAAGQSSNRLAAFHIDQKTGMLTRIATYDAGQRPWWVHAVRIR